MKTKILITIALLFVACADKQKFKSSNQASNAEEINKPYPTNKGQKVLRVGKQMVKDKKVVRGSCWDYINAVYNTSGFPYKKRKYVFLGKKNRPPYASLNSIQPGDWLYYINHSYKKVEHSGIFVRWHNKKRAQALILSYKGEGRNAYGRYKIYNIKNTYTIIRAK